MKRWTWIAPLIIILSLGVFVFITGCGGDNNNSEETYEYKFVSHEELFGGSLIKAKLSGKLPELEQKALHTLNELGKQGWELVQISDGVFYFIKEKD